MKKNRRKILIGSIGLITAASSGISGCDGGTPKNPQKATSKYDQLKTIIEMLKKTIEALQTQNDSQKRLIDLLTEELREKNG